MLSKQLEELGYQVEAEGYVIGTPMYEKVLRARKVALCQEIRRIPSCSGCDFYDECSLAKEHLRDRLYK